MKNETKTIIMWCLITAIGLFAILVIIGNQAEKSDFSGSLQNAIPPREYLIEECMGEDNIASYDFCACGADVMIKEMEKGNWDVEKMVKKALDKCYKTIY